MAKTMPKNTTEFFPEAELCPEYSESPEDSTQERPFECKAKHAALSTHRAQRNSRTDVSAARSTRCLLRTPRQRVTGEGRRSKSF